jgi:CRISPR-associated protein Cst2
MTTQQKVKNNIFGTVLTEVMPASNYRGDTEDNRSILQKLRYPDGDHTVFSAEAIRNRLRDMLSEDGQDCNRSRAKNEKELTVRYKEYPNPLKYADDKLFGFLAVNKRKDIEAAQKKLKEAKDSLKKEKDKAKRAPLEKDVNDRQKEVDALLEFPDFQGDSVLRVNYAVSLDAFPQRSRQTMHQSPKIQGAFSNADSSALIYREVHVSAYQYPFGLNINDLVAKDKKGDIDQELTNTWKKWGAYLLKAIGELNGVAGNHARTMFPFAPASIVLRLTSRRTPDFDLYGFSNGHSELLDALEKQRLPREDFFIGGRIARETDDLRKLLTDKDRQTSKLAGVKAFSTADAAIEALIREAELDSKPKGV